MMKKVNIRTLAGSDLADVTALDDQSGYNYTQWVEELGSDEETTGCYGAFIDDRLVGYCTVSDADDDVEIENHPLWTVDAQMLNYVFVEAESRGKGVGSVLINEALKEAGPVAIYTKISRSDLAAFYQKAGFELIDRKQSVMFRLNKSEQSNQKLWAISKKINDLNMGAITMLAPDEVCESVMVYNALVRNGYADTQRTSVADMFVRYGFKSEIVNNFWHITL